MRDGKLQASAFTSVCRATQRILPAALWDRQLCFIIRICHIACDIQTVLLTASTEYKLFITKQYLLIAAVTAGFHLMHERKQCKVLTELF